MSISDVFTMFANKIMDVLPTSPLAPFVGRLTGVFSPYIGYLNYFIPVGLIVDIFVAWLSAVALFYLYSIIMRWIKMIGD